MILKYQKHITTYTTYALIEPDYNDDDERCTELCTIGDNTYVHVPDSVVLPEQPFEIEVTMETIILSDELIAEIKALSPHVRLINQRVVAMIRDKYSATDELKIYREYVEYGRTETTEAYLTHVAAARAWGQEQKSAIGLGS